MISIVKSDNRSIFIIRHDDKMCHPECLKKNSKITKWITYSNNRCYNGQRENGYCELFRTELDEKSKSSKKRFRCYMCLKATGDL